MAKTTSAINLGAALSELSRRVLLVDFDPQGALTAGIGLAAGGLVQTIYGVMRGSHSKIQDVITRTESGFEVAPANIDLAAIELELANEPGRERILREKLSPVLSTYDYILIDCPPSLGLLTLNALAAASRVIIPVQTQYFALRGMDLLLATIEKVKVRINPELVVAGILPTMFDSRTRHSREALDDMQEKFKGVLFKTVTPYTVKLQDSAVVGESILRTNPDSAVAESYRALAKEVEQRG